MKSWLFFLAVAFCCFLFHVLHWHYIHKSPSQFFVSLPPSSSVHTTLSLSGVLDFWWLVQRAPVVGVEGRERGHEEASKYVGFLLYIYIYNVGFIIFVSYESSTCGWFAKSVIWLFWRLLGWIWCGYCQVFNIKSVIFNCIMDSSIHVVW